MTEFAKLSNLEGAASRLTLHIEHATFALNCMVEEINDINNNKTAEPCLLRHVLARSESYADVVFDYLSMLETEASELYTIVNEMFDCQESEV